MEVDQKPVSNESSSKILFLFVGPLAACVLGIVLVGFGSSSAICWTAAVTLLCAVWWFSEPIPIAATSLLPLAVFPLCGVLSFEQVAQSYGNKLILLMLGGFMLSAAMERSGAHRRIALYMVNICGGSSGRRLVFGFMLASALLSMWISNAATTLMLLPIALAVVAQTNNRELQVSLLLGIAYAASIGGIGTPIGTPPNLVFMEVYSINTGVEPGFLDWMGWSLPVVAIMLPIAGLWLTWRIGKIEPISLPDVGRWRKAEVRTLVVFAITALFWITRNQPFGGWSSWSGLKGANDASVALLGAVALFVIPNGDPDKAAERLLDWRTAARLPWGVLILFAGGICIATAFLESGLSKTLGGALVEFGQLPPLLLIGLICLSVTFLTEITSNTATANLLLPILAAAAIAADHDPKIWMIPATLSASFAFMLPVATPPNAIVFGSDKLTVREMAREGLALNLVGVIVVTLYCYTMFGGKA